MNKENIKEHVFFVKGLHCQLCEFLVKDALGKLPGVSSVKVTSSKNRVCIESSGENLGLDKLNQMFADHGYVFSNLSPEVEKKSYLKNIIKALVIAGLVIIIFNLINKSGLASAVNVNSKSSLFTFILFGIMAGLSSCAALVGGLLISMSGRWNSIYGQNSSIVMKSQPYLLFNIGRLISFFIFGSLLGFLGNTIKLSLTGSSILIFAISIFMIFLGLDMLGVKLWNKFNPVPHKISNYIANADNFRGRFMPLLLGALTFFLPCGFTITAQSLALLSGNSLTGGLIMLAFALGTLPMLLFISIFSVKFLMSSKWQKLFLTIGGIIVIFFALFNMNSQLNVLGVTSLDDLGKTENNNSDNLTSLIDNKQVIKMEANSRGYNPNYFRVKNAIPVRWEITDTGTSGCTNAIIAKELFIGQIDLTPGMVSVKEFTPTKVGKFKFSCWMGMVTGVVEVIDNGSSSINQSDNNTSEPGGTCALNKNEGSCK